MTQKATKVDELDIVSPDDSVHLLALQGGGTVLVPFVEVLALVPETVLTEVAALADDAKAAGLARQQAQTAALSATANQILTDTAKAVTVAARSDVTAKHDAVVAAAQQVASDTLLVAADRAAAEAASSGAASTSAQVLGLLADSGSAVEIGTGDKMLAVATGKGFAAGMPIRVSSKANPDTHAMIGVVKSYGGSTLVVTVASVLGTGTRSDWTLAVTGGALAPIGATQDAQAIVQTSRLERALAAAGVPDEPSLILDFKRNIVFAKGAYVGSSPLALVAALPGSSYTRASTGTAFGNDGLLKTAASGVPRVDYDPVTRLPRGLLLEPSRTNHAIYSDQFDNATWLKTNVTVTPNAALAPDGTLTAALVVENASAGSHFITSSNINLPKAATYTFSIFFQAEGRTKGHININAYNGDQVFGLFDLAAGTIAPATFGGTASGGTATGNRTAIKYLGGGFYWLSVSGQPSTAGGNGLQIGLSFRDDANNTSYVGDGVSGVHVWRAQIEPGAEATSSIKTEASAVTRAADALTLGGGAWLNAAAMTALVEFDVPRLAASAAYPVTIRDPAATNNVNVRTASSIAGVDFHTVYGGTTQIDSGSIPVALETPVRIAFSLSSSAWAFSGDGGAPITGGATTLPPGMDRMHLGAVGFVGHISRILLFPQALGAAKVQALSNLASWS